MRLAATARSRKSPEFRPWRLAWNRNFLVAILAATLLVSWNCQQQVEESVAGGGTESSKSAAPGPRPVQPLTVAAGTQVSIRLIDPIDTGKTPLGATFSGTLASDLKAGNRVVAPRGSTVTGEVTHVVNSGRLKRPAEHELILSTLRPRGGKTYTLKTDLAAWKGKSHTKRNVGMIGGGAGAGALIGGLTGGKKGALIGSAIGAGGGTAAAAATGKQEIQLAPETVIDFQLACPLRIPPYSAG